MKKFLVIAFALGGLLAGATTNKLNVPVSIEKQEKVYTKTTTDKVPVTVLKEISEKYEGYNISAAYVAEDGEYKLELAKETTVVTVFYNAKGEFVKEQK